MLLRLRWTGERSGGFKMKTDLRLQPMLALTALIFFSLFVLMESSAWARAGGGRSSGSRGSRSFSAPSSPSSPSPSSPYSSPKSGLSGPGSGTSPGSTGTFGRSPFLQGLAGGVAGGFLGNLLFGGRGYASGMGGTGGGGIGFLDILILGVLGYFAWRFFKRRRQMADAGAYYADTGSLRTEGSFSSPAPSYPQEQTGYSSHDDVQKGLYQIGQFDSSFTEEAFKETAQDLFFRIQAGWMNRSLDGIQPLLDNQMAEYCRSQGRSDGSLARDWKGIHYGSLDCQPS
jgi:predicted lipid-binding transport protein (Tim44 family)